ncbi:hypothetical protein [Haloferax sp. ATB1]|uniref:hypothetical protein n=1 Tax=Haloferax sp. ATB1 TaxID=1508454 RepID=UPI000FE14A00|nr:hypothetical protein [Haloferax sp. ATB1]
MDVTEGPPFANSPDHLDPSEFHRRDDRLRRGNHPLANADRDEILTSLLRTIRANGTRRTLTQFYVHNLLRMNLLRHADQSRTTSNPTGLEISPEQDPGLPPRLIQFGVGAALRTDAETTDAQSFEQIATHLLEIKNWYARQGGSLLPLDSPMADPYFGMVWRELTTLRHASGFQMLEKGYRAYKPWEQEMEKLLGFSIEDAVYYTRELTNWITPRLEGQDKEVARWCPSLLDFSQKAIDLTDEAVWVPEETLVDWCDDSPRFHKFLDRLTVVPGAVSGFRTPVDVNPLERAPLVRTGDEYLLPLPRTVLYALANTFYYDLIGSEYQGAFQLQFGDWLEEWTVDCLSKTFSEDDIIQNYTYEYDGEDVEGDILILRDDEPIVIECKGKKLRAETRKGNFGGIDAIKEDIERGIGDAYHQANRLVTGVQSGQITEIETSDGTTVGLEPSSLEDARRWLVLGESYGSIATRDFAKILDMSPVPYVCDIYDLQVLTEVLETPERLLHYVRQRTRQTTVQLRRPGTQYANSKTFSSDEVDYLAVYRRNGWEFPPGAQRITGAGDNLREDAIDSIMDRGEFRFTF